MRHCPHGAQKQNKKQFICMFGLGYFLLHSFICSRSGCIWNSSILELSLCCVQSHAVVHQVFSVYSVKRNIFFLCCSYFCNKLDKTCFTFYFFYEITAHNFVIFFFFFQIYISSIKVFEATKFERE